MQEIKRKKDMMKKEYVEYRRVYRTNWERNKRQRLSEEKSLHLRTKIVDSVNNDQEKENEKQVDEIELATPGLQSLQEEVICKDKLIASQNIEIADWRARFELLETEKMRLQTNQSRLSERIVSLLWVISEHGQNDMTPQHSNSLQNVNKRKTLQK